jgi:hypothetical protein
MCHRRIISSITMNRVTKNRIGDEGGQNYLILYYRTILNLEFTCSDMSSMSFYKLYVLPSNSPFF